MILLPFAIDPHGRWGPILQNFLYHAETTLEYKFYATQLNAKIMFHKATNDPCPLGILKTADFIWKQHKERTFFGHSYTAPTPSMYTIQQLGLGITKAYTSHYWNVIKNSTPTQTLIGRNNNHSHTHDVPNLNST